MRLCFTGEVGRGSIFMYQRSLLTGRAMLEIIILSGVAVDMYGVPTQDGTGQAWEYTDG